MFVSSPKTSVTLLHHDIGDSLRGLSGDTSLINPSSPQAARHVATVQRKRGAAWNASTARVLCPSVTSRVARW